MSRIHPGYDFPAVPDEDDPRPWEEPGAVRRDSLPHRSRLLEVIGWAGLLCGLMSLLFLPCIIGVILSVLSVVLARRDLGVMRAGLMDPAGKEGAESAFISGCIGITFGVLAGLIWGALLLALITG